MPLPDASSDETDPWISKNPNSSQTESTEPLVMNLRVQSDLHGSATYTFPFYTPPSLPGRQVFDPFNQGKLTNASNKNIHYTTMLRRPLSLDEQQAVSWPLVDNSWLTGTLSTVRYAAMAFVFLAPYPWFPRGLRILKPKTIYERRFIFLPAGSLPAVFLWHAVRATLFLSGTLSVSYLTLGSYAISRELAAQKSNPIRQRLDEELEGKKKDDWEEVKRRFGFETDSEGYRVDVNEKDQGKKAGSRIMWVNQVKYDLREGAGGKLMWGGDFTEMIFEQRKNEGEYKAFANSQREIMRRKERGLPMGLGTSQISQPTDQNQTSEQSPWASQSSQQQSVPSWNNQDSQPPSQPPQPDQDYQVPQEPPQQQPTSYPWDATIKADTTTASDDASPVASAASSADSGSSWDRVRERAAAADRGEPWAKWSDKEPKKRRDKPARVGFGEGKSTGDGKDDDGFF
jgi:hypothetical protein